MLDGEHAVVKSEDDFTIFYEKWRPPIRRALVMALGNVALADEAVDEAMTRAVARWETIRAYESPEGWLYRVGINWARGTFRKRRYEFLSDTPDSPVPGDPLRDPAVIEAVGRLSLKLRTVVVARYYLDWSTTEVANALGIPEGTVKSRLSRALNRLGQELGDST